MNNPPTKPWYQSRTLWVNALLIVLMVLSQVPTLPNVPPEYLPYIAMGVGVANMLLRLITGTPLAGTPAAASATNITIQTGGVATGDNTQADTVVGGDVAGRIRADAVAAGELPPIADQLAEAPRATPGRWTAALDAAAAKRQEKGDATDV